MAIDGKGERSAIKYSGTEEYLNSTMYIVGSKNGNSQIYICQYNFNLRVIYLYTHCFQPSITILKFCFIDHVIDR